MTTPSEFPDAEALVIDWLSAKDSIVDKAVSGRVYTKIPGEPTLPLIRVTRVGGPCTEDEDSPRIQIEAWAADGDQSGAMDVMRAIISGLQTFAGQQPSDGPWVVGPWVRTGPVQSEDVPTGQERYWAEISFNTYPEAVTTP